MISSEVEIIRASQSDLDGIIALQAENQPENGGTLFASLSHSRIIKMMREMPLIIARRGKSITGYLMSSSLTTNADVPIISAMLAAYSGTSGAYVYGPICVSKEDRGKGLAQAMFMELKRLVPAREGILLTRCNNMASLRAHTKMGMCEVARFQYGENEFAVFSYFG